MLEERARKERLHIERREREAILKRWKRTRPRSPAEARHRLMELVESLGRLRLSSDVAAALLAYLVRAVDTLDEAFGLAPIVRRGAPLRPSTTARLQKAVRLLLKGWTWPKIVDEVGGEERELRRLIAERLKSLMQSFAAEDVKPLWSLAEIQERDLARLQSPTTRASKKPGG